MYRNTYALIDLGNIKHNVRELRKNLGNKVRIMAVVKANAYGHGAILTAQAALEAGATWLGVATPEEALELRKAHITAPILVLGIVSNNSYEVLIRNDVSICVCCPEAVEEAAKAARFLENPARLHVKVDSGMGRIGIRSIGELTQIMERFPANNNVLFEGLFTHFATADEMDKTYTYQQLKRFTQFRDAAIKAGFKPVVHAANSAAATEIPEAGFDMVRQGITLYGCYPSNEVDKSKMALKQAMSIVAQIVYIKTVHQGDSVSYGRKFTADSDRRIATLAIGYADGYKRAFTNKAEVLVHGKRANVVGTVCMDQIMIDVTDISEANVGEQVVLLGYQEGGFISADELAGIAGTINYEILTSVSERIVRVYTDGNPD